jgi:hypothetical protein
MSRTDVLRGATAIALLATTLAGCGSGTGSSPTGTGPVRPTATVDHVADAPVPVPVTAGAFDLDDPAGLCAIFPADRAAAALGEPVGPASATHSSTFANTSCHYDSTGSDASVTVWYHPGLVRTEWERQMAKIGMTPEMSVAGIGEAAYRLDPTATHPRVKLTAFEGDHDVWVIIADVADITTIASTAEREARDLLAAVR